MKPPLEVPEWAQRPEFVGWRPVEIPDLNVPWLVMAARTVQGTELVIDLGGTLYPTCTLSDYLIDCRYCLPFPHPHAAAVEGNRLVSLFGGMVPMDGAYKGLPAGSLDFDTAEVWKANEPKKVIRRCGPDCRCIGHCTVHMGMAGHTYPDDCELCGTGTCRMYSGHVRGSSDSKERGQDAHAPKAVTDGS